MSSRSERQLACSAPLRTESKTDLSATHLTAWHAHLVWRFQLDHEGEFDHVLCHSAAYLYDLRSFGSLVLHELKLKLKMPRESHGVMLAVQPRLPYVQYCLYCALDTLYSIQYNKQYSKDLRRGR